jgi:tetratricopeptide (TPR) repeat protein
MRIALIITLILLTCLTPGLAQQSRTSASQPTVPKNVGDLLERAAKLSQAGRGSLAITLIQEAIRISPDSPAPHLALGTEYAKANRFNEAIAEFEEARKINPRDDQVYLSVGLVMLQQKKYAAALSLFSDASLLNPQEPLHHLMRGVAFVREATDKQFSGTSNKAERDRILSQAEEALRRAFDLSGGHLVDVYLYRARVYELRGARMEAASELEKYLKASPDAAGANAVREAIRNLQTKVAP